MVESILICWKTSAQVKVYVVQVSTYSSHGWLCATLFWQFVVLYSYILHISFH